MNKFKEKILMIAETAEGKTFGEIDKLNLLSEKGNKGALGHVVEENVFKYKRNSKSEMDFPKAKMELKVTPYKINKNGSYSAKERLVLNIIDYKEEYKYDFYNSTFWKKSSNILLFLYEHLYGKPRGDFKITHIYDLKLDENEKDLKIFKQDFEIIKNKILKGEAHNISEADTMYLGACTKGATAASSYRGQPFNISVKAKQRAYSLKTTYMTQLIRNIIESQEYETIFLDEELNEKLSFEENINAKVSKYIGKSVTELRKIFNVFSKSKNITETLFARMLGVQGKLSQTDEFLKANIVPKFIRLNKNGSITESMSFPSFSFIDLVKRDWHQSELYKYLNSHKFLFVIYEFNTDNELLFTGVKLWNIPYDVLESEIKKVFNKTKEVIATGDIVRSITPKGIRLSNFPDKRFSEVAHVRPHARNREDTYPLPVSDNLTGLDEYTKHCFWLNNDYIAHVIKYHKG